MYAMKEWVAGTKFIGEFKNADANTIIDHIEKLSLDAIQIDEHTGIEVLIEIQDIPVFKEISIPPNFDLDYIKSLLEQFQPYCRHFIFKTDLSHDSSLNSLAEKYSIWLDGDFEVEKVLSSAYSGICLHGGMEEKVGYKSFDELDEILEKLEKE